MIPRALSPAVAHYCCALSATVTLSRRGPDNVLTKMKKGFFAKKSSPTELNDRSKSIPDVVNKRLNVLVSESSKDSLELFCDKQQGRYLVAKRRFEPGEVLMTAQYFATVAIQNNADICSRCLSHGKGETNCQLCGSTFCCKSCFDLFSAG
jgi:hypothetical protein